MSKYGVFSAWGAFDGAFDGLFWSRAFDAADVCEAVGNFLLYQLSKNYNKKDIGLYRDDGLAIFKNVSGSKAEKIKKIYKSCLKITT